MEPNATPFSRLDLKQSQSRLQAAVRRLSEQPLSLECLQACQIAASTLKTVSSLHGQPHVEQYAAQVAQLLASAQPISPKDVATRFLPRLNAIERDFEVACRLASHQGASRTVSEETALSDLVETLHGLETSHMAKASRARSSVDEARIPAEVRLEAVCHGLLPWVRQAAGEARKELAITLDVPGDIVLPARTVAPVQAILIHLLRNVVLHGIESPITRQALEKPTAGHVILQARVEKATLTLTVADDGPGLPTAPPEAPASYGTERVAAREGGLGIGLHVVRSQVERLYGEFELCSIPLEGTSAVVRIPLKPLASLEDTDA